MDQNHEETETAQVSADQSASAETAAPQAANTAPQAAAEAAAPEGDPAEKAAAPARRRASRRVSAAVGEVVAPPTEPGAPTADAAAAKTESQAESQAEATDGVAASEPAEEAPKKRVSRARKKVESSETGEPAGDTAASAPTDAEPAADQAAAEQTPAEEAPAKPARATRARSTRTTTKKAAESAASTASDESAEGGAEAGTVAEDSAVKPAEAAASEAAAPDTAAADASNGADAGTADAAAGEASTPRRRNTRSRSRKPANDAAASEATQGEQADAASAPAAEAAADSASGNGEQNQDRDTAEAQNGDNGDRQESGSRESQPRSNRTRQRERKRRGPNDDGELELSDDDVLLPIAGILDVLDNYAFVRTSGYLPGTGDVYVSLGQVKKYGLRKGDAVVGAIRQPREGDSGGRQKYNAIVRVDTVNSGPADEQQTRPDFAELTPVHPAERMRLETDSATLGPRVIDLFAPVGKGQRGLIIGPHESGKSALLRQIAHAVAQNQPGAHLMMVLIDERPEEVTELQRSINGEVIASTFDRPAEDHTTIAELAIERAKRLVELGHDVVVLIDSLTDLARAYNLAAPAAVRVPAGNLDAAAVFPVKRLLSAARNIENGGSLTILATVSAQADSRLDEALIGELEGIANMQLRMSGEAADRRVFPAIELRRSSTRNEQLITSDAEHRVISQLRRRLRDASETEALDTVLGELGRTSSNVEFLAVTQRAQA